MIPYVKAHCWMNPDSLFTKSRGSERGDKINPNLPSCVPREKHFESIFRPL